MSENAGVKRGYLHEAFRLFHLRDEAGADTELHYHEFEKLVLVMEGSGTYTIEGRRYTLVPGDIILLRDHAAHLTAFPAGLLYERYIFYISREFLESSGSSDTDLFSVFAGGGSPVLRLNREQSARLAALASRCEREIRSSAFGSSLMAREALLRLLVELGRLQGSGAYTVPQPSPVRDSKILEILRYLDAHLTEPVSIDELSDRFYLSKYHMMRRFKEEVGQSVHQYLSAKRLQRARDLISAGQSAGDACFACGFHSYSAFSRAYGKYFGASPGEKTAPPELIGQAE